jgi:hypothetical protein
MKLEFEIGARRVKGILLDGDDRLVAGAGLSGETRHVTANALCARSRRKEAFQPEAAHAAIFVARPARWRCLAAFAKEISQ